MPRPVPAEAATRRRARLAALLDALGAARGSRVTQREFAASIGREQGTVGAILGGHRALGGDVMLAIVQAYQLPPDFFDSPLAPDPRPFARAAVGAVPVASPVAAVPRGRLESPAVGVRAPPVSVAYGAHDPGLSEALRTLVPERAVAMALDLLSRRGVHLDADGWARTALDAQSASDHGALGAWTDRALADPESLAPARPVAKSSRAVRPSRGRVGGAGRG